MRFASEDPKEIILGSIWKHTAWVIKQVPNQTSDNQDFIVSRVGEDHVRFGRIHEPNQHEFRTARFLNALVPIRDPLIKLKTQLFAVLSPLRGCPDLQEEYQKLLIEMDI